MIDVTVTAIDSIFKALYCCIALVLLALLVKSRLARAFYDYCVSGLEARAAYARHDIQRQSSISTAIQGVTPTTSSQSPVSQLALGDSDEDGGISRGRTERKRSDQSESDAKLQRVPSDDHVAKTMELQTAVTAALAPITDKLQELEKKVVAPIQSVATSAAGVASSISTVERLAAVAFISSAAIYFADRMYKRYAKSDRTKESAISGILSATHLALAAILVMSGGALWKVWKDIGNWLSLVKTTVTAWSFFQGKTSQQKHELSTEVVEIVGDLEGTLEQAVQITSADEQRKKKEAEDKKRDKRPPKIDAATGKECPPDCESEGGDSETQDVHRHRSASVSETKDQPAKQAACRCTTSRHWQKRLHVHTWWGIIVDEGLQNDDFPEFIDVDEVEHRQKILEAFEWKKSALKCDLADCRVVQALRPESKQVVATVYLNDSIGVVPADSIDIPRYMLVRLGKELGFARALLYYRAFLSWELTFQKPRSSPSWNRLVEINLCNATALLRARVVSAAPTDAPTGEIDAKTFWQRVPEAATEFWGRELPHSKDDPAAIQYLAKIGAGKLLVIIIVAAALTIAAIKLWPKPKRTRTRRKKESDPDEVYEAPADERERDITIGAAKGNLRRSKVDRGAGKLVFDDDDDDKWHPRRKKEQSDAQARLNASKPKAVKFCYAFVRGVECKRKGCPLNHSATPAELAAFRALLHRYPCKFLEQCEVKGCPYIHPNQDGFSKAENPKKKKEGVTRWLLGDKTWDLTPRQAYDQRVGCVHAPDCKAVPAIITSSGVACNRHCGGHHCVHYVSCNPVKGGPPVDETKRPVKEGQFGIGRVDPQPIRDHQFLLFEGGRLITHSTHVQNEAILPAHYFAPDGTSDWNAWEAKTAPFQAKRQMTFTTFDGKESASGELLWHVYPAHDFAWATIQHLFPKHKGARIGQIVKPVPAVMVIASPRSTPDNIVEEFAYTRHIDLDPAGRHDAHTSPSTCGACLYHDNKALAMHIEQTQQCNRATPLWSWREILGKPWKDGKPDHAPVA